MNSALSDKENELKLVSDSVNGDREAFRQLVEKYHFKMLRLVTNMVRSVDDAEDIVQDIFIKAFTSLSSFKGHSSFYTWLYRIAFNMTIDFKRKVARKEGNNTSDLEELDSGKVFALGVNNEVENPAQSLLRKEQALQIDKALKNLSAEHRTVMILREVDGLSYEEIAKITGSTMGTVMSRLHYARKKLQSYLENLDKDDQQQASKFSPNLIDSTNFLSFSRSI